jgi:allantoicase
MGDGWETKRRRGPGHDWAIIQLALPGTISRLVIDTDHNKGNYPDTADIEATTAPANSDLDQADWFTLLPRQKLQAHMAHRYSDELAEHSAITHLRLRIFPDGGVSRLRVFGRPSAEGLVDAGLAWLNALPTREATAAVQACCASSAWASRMVDARPFTSVFDALTRAESAADALTDTDWLEAFSGHPRIGGKSAEKHTGTAAEEWSAVEQAGVANASETTKARLARLNDEYFDKHGFIFIICATEQNADEMSNALAERVSNDTPTEIRNASAEQRKITALRLNKYLGT